MRGVPAEPHLCELTAFCGDISRRVEVSSRKAEVASNTMPKIIAVVLVINSPNYVYLLKVSYSSVGNCISSMHRKYQRSSTNVTCDVHAENTPIKRKPRDKRFTFQFHAKTHLSINLSNHRVLVISYAINQTDFAD